MMQKRVRKKKAAPVRFVIIGGGVAAVACAQQIAKLCSTDQANQAEIILISSSTLLKEVTTNFFIVRHIYMNHNYIFSNTIMNNISYLDRHL